MYQLIPKVIPFLRSGPLKDVTHSEQLQWQRWARGTPHVYCWCAVWAKIISCHSSACLIFMCVLILLLLHTTLFWAATQTVAEVISQFLQRGKLHLYVVIYKKDSPPHCLSRLIINTSNKLKVSASSIFSIRKIVLRLN